MKKNTKRAIGLVVFYLFIAILIVKGIPFLFNLIMESWAKGYAKH